MTEGGGKRKMQTSLCGILHLILGDFPAGFTSHMYIFRRSGRTGPGTPKKLIYYIDILCRFYRLQCCLFDMISTVADRILSLSLVWCWLKKRQLLAFPDHGRAGMRERTHRRNIPRTPVSGAVAPPSLGILKFADASQIPACSWFPHEHPLLSALLICMYDTAHPTIFFSSFLFG